MTSAEFTEFDRDVRGRIYERFGDTGGGPGASDLARDLGATTEEVEASFDRRAAAHALVLEPDSHRIWMAHPFSGRPTGHAVEVGDVRYFANCAWDALALPSFLGRPARAKVRCPDCDEELRWRVDDGGRLHASDAVVHFLVPARKFWDDVGFT